MLTGKRIANNWRLVLALFIGMLLAASIAAAIPIYAAGSLQDSFLTQWVNRDSFRAPFTLIISHRNQYRKEPVTGEEVAALREELRRLVPRRVGLQPTGHTVYSRLGSQAFTDMDVSQPGLTAPRADLAQLENLKEVATIVQGRWYEAGNADAVEAVVDEATLEDMELIVGETYRYFYSTTDDRRIGIPVKIVGFFEANPGTTAEDWMYPPPFHRVIFVDPSVYQSFLLEDLDFRARQYDMQWVFDFREVRAHDLPVLIEELESIESYAAERLPETGYWHSPLSFFRDFNARMSDVRSFILSLAVPTLVLALYYVTLIASLSFRRRETEIVVLLSRGAGRTQVVTSFLLEWLLVSGVSFIVSPFVGMAAARAVGASTGFLSFVDRQALSVALMPQAWWFALIASATGLLAGMIPTFGTFKYSIVTFKQERGRRQGKRPLWSRLYLDIILLAIAGFGYRDLTMQSRAAAGQDILSNDPVFFLAPFVAVFGAGLLCLRLFPLIVGFAHWASVKFRGVVIQMTFRELHRNAQYYAPLILLIVLTVATGIYSASAARTLGENFEDQIYYRVGADLAVREQWHPPQGGGPVSTPEPVSGRMEPPFYQRLDLAGVESAARVFRARVGVSQGSTTLGRANMMAVVPREFAQTAWFRPDLAPSHFYNYLKLLQRHPEGVLVSQAAARSGDAELGDVLTISYHGQRLQVYIVGTVRYWPGMFPDDGPFLVANLGHIQSYARLEPYEVWYDLAAGASVQELIDASVSLGVYATDFTYARGEVQELRREPYRMGFFGILSMGFVVSGLVTALGIFAYSLFSMHNRRVQFGSLRALGLSSRQLVSVLGLEHVTSFVVGLLAGVGVGLGTVRLFLPFLRDRAQELQAVPPFLIITEPVDLYRILIVLSVVLTATVSGLAVILRRIRLGEAIRLGEEM